MKLTDARLCDELECLLGAREEIPLIVSLLRVLGLIICRPVNGAVPKEKHFLTECFMNVSQQPLLKDTKQHPPPLKKKHNILSSHLSLMMRAVLSS